MALTTRTTAARTVVQEIEETRRIATQEVGLILPTQMTAPIPLDFNWVRARLYGKQEAAIFERKRISVIEASTKSGKTEGCIVWLMERAIKGRRNANYWWVAPVSAQAAIAYGRMRDKVTEQTGMRERVSCYAAQGNQKIVFPNGATVWFKTGDNPDSLYGEDVYGVVVDEASRMKEDAWIAIQSTLTATRGPVRIIGNVKGKKNWFYLLARRAQHGDPEMAWHKMDAFDAVAAGVLALEEIEAVRGRMPEHVFKELYLAEASDDEGNPFGIDHIRACVQPKTEGQPYVWGWDLAKRRDWTVGIALDRQGRWVDFHRFQKPCLHDGFRLMARRDPVGIRLGSLYAKPRNPTINGCSESKAVAHNNS